MTQRHRHQRICPQHPDQNRRRTMVHQSRTYPFARATPNHLSALTAGPFCWAAKGTKNARVPTSGPTLRYGSLLSGAAPSGTRQRAIHGLRRLAGSCPPSRLRDTSVQPADGPILWCLHVQRSTAQRARALALALALDLDLDLDLNPAFRRPRGALA